MATRKIERTKAKPPAPAGAEPVASRPRFPPEYAAARGRKGMLPWSHVGDRMRDAQHYWICTVSAEGRPDARPVDGVWLHDRLYFGGSPETRWHRNITANPAVCIHLENAMDVVTLQGSARLEKIATALARELAQVSNAKYGYGTKPEEYVEHGVLCFRPRLVLAWTNLGKDPTKWEF
jgi:general stress protein 26